MTANPPTLILASQSPRRRELLASAGVRFAVAVPNAEEVFDESQSVEENLARIAREKASAVRSAHPASWILACDTVVVITMTDQKIDSATRCGSDLVLGKPRDHGDAARMLRALSGREHRVVSAYSLLDPQGVERSRNTITTRVLFGELSDRQIARYLMTGEPADKAGAYGIQGGGAVFVRSIIGSYTNVVGLPLAEVCESLSKYGVGDFA